MNTYTVMLIKDRVRNWLVSRILKKRACNVEIAIEEPTWAVSEERAFEIPSSANTWGIPSIRSTPEENEWGVSHTPEKYRWRLTSINEEDRGGLACTTDEVICHAPVNTQVVSQRSRFSIPIYTPTKKNHPRTDLSITPKTKREELCGMPGTQFISLLANAGYGFVLTRCNTRTQTIVNQWVGAGEKVLIPNKRLVLVDEKHFMVLETVDYLMHPCCIDSTSSCNILYGPRGTKVSSIRLANTSLLLKKITNCKSTINEDVDGDRLLIVSCLFCVGSTTSLNSILLMAALVKALE
jgi:hypothetical protein